MHLLAFEELLELAQRALIAHGATPSIANTVARALVVAEAEGNVVCGLVYLPIFCTHLRNGKVDGKIEPEVRFRAPAAVEVDARHGFAQPAIAAGMPLLIDAAKRCGIAAMGVKRSYNALALSDPVTVLVEQGFVALACSNAPASVASPGGKRAIFGTNPIAFAAPSADGPPVIFDQSSSATTRTALRLMAERTEAIPLGWAQDRNGRPTTDARLGFEGAMLPSGGQKGANIALMIEVLAAALTGATASADATSLATPDGLPPSIGQLVVAIDPSHFSGAGVGRAVSALASRIHADGLKLPGTRRRESLSRSRTEGILVNPEMQEEITRLASAE
jgi:(2R)-3-sulfolactate dehydrogenase (NADP+)